MLLKDVCTDIRGNLRQKLKCYEKDTTMYIKLNTTKPIYTYFEHFSNQTQSIKSFNAIMNDSTGIMAPKHNSTLFLLVLVVVIRQLASISGMTYAHMTLQNQCNANTPNDILI